MKLKDVLIFSLTCVVFFAFTIFIVMKVVFGKYKETTIKTNFDITIEKIDAYRGYLYINDSLQIGSRFLDTDSSRFDLEEFVRIGDRMIKTRGTEDISLIRGDSVYVFRQWVAPKDWY